MEERVMESQKVIEDNSANKDFTKVLEDYLKDLSLLTDEVEARRKLKVDYVLADESVDPWWKFSDDKIPKEFPGGDEEKKGKYLHEQQKEKKIKKGGKELRVPRWKRKRQLGTISGLSRCRRASSVFREDYCVGKAYLQFIPSEKDISRGEAVLGIHRVLPDIELIAPPEPLLSTKEYWGARRLGDEFVCFVKKEPQPVPDGVEQNSVTNGTAAPSNASSPTIFCAFLGAVPIAVENVVRAYSNMQLCHASKEDQWNLLWCGKNTSKIKSRTYRFMSPHQKVNRLPGMENMVSKQRFQRQLFLVRDTYEFQQLDFIVPEFVIPRDLDAADAYVGQLRTPSTWLVTPLAKGEPASFQPFLLEDPDDLPYGFQCKLTEFDHDMIRVGNDALVLHMFVVVTSVEPLRVFVHENGVISKLVWPLPEEVEVIPFLEGKEFDKVFPEEVQTNSLEQLLRLKSFIAKVDVSKLLKDMKDIMLRSILVMESILLNGITGCVKHAGNGFELLEFQFNLTRGPNDAILPRLLKVVRPAFDVPSSENEAKVLLDVIVDTLNIVRVSNVDIASTKNALDGEKKDKVLGKTIYRSSLPSLIYVGRSLEDDAVINMHQRCMRELEEEYARKNQYDLLFPVSYKKWRHECRMLFTGPRPINDFLCQMYLERESDQDSDSNSDD